MNNDDMNRTLAEVEGKCWHDHGNYCHPTTGIYTCTKCGEIFETHDAALNCNSNYSTNLEACMRVARKMGLDVLIRADGYILIEMVRIQQNALDWMSDEACEVGEEAATLCPMLVEIAEERKG